MTYTPATLAERWATTPEAVLLAIRANRLSAFTLSSPDAKRPRWRITQEAVEAFERGEQPQASKAHTKQRRRARPSVKFYT